MTITEKLYLMERMERKNAERAARMTPATVDCWYYKENPHDQSWFVIVRGTEELTRRGCTHNKGGGWSLDGAIHDLNKTLEFFNLSIGKVEKRPW